VLHVEFKPPGSGRLCEALKTLTQGELLPDRARERIARSERLVYLFPAGFDPAILVEERLGDGFTPLTEIEFEVMTAPPAGAVSVSRPRTFVGWLNGEPFAIELRERSATMIAEPFWTRRDLLLAVKELVEERRLGREKVA